MSIPVRIEIDLDYDREWAGILDKIHVTMIDYKRKYFDKPEAILLEPLEYLYVKHYDHWLSMDHNNIYKYGSIVDHTDTTPKIFGLQVYCSVGGFIPNKDHITYFVGVDNERDNTSQVDTEKPEGIQ